MTVVDRAINRALRRLVLQSAIDRFGQFAIAALAASLLLLLTERLLAIAVSWWVYLGLFIAAGLAAGLMAWITRPTRQHAAALVDERLKLKDHFGTALYAENLAQTNPFARQVVNDANRLASNTRVNQAFALHLGRAWNAAWPIAVVIALCYWLLPNMDLANFEAHRRQQQLAEAQQAEAVEQITLAETIMTDANTGQGRLSEADPTQLSQELASLTRRNLRNPDMREKASAQLSDVQERLSIAQQALDMEVKMVKNAFSGIEPKTTGPADKFAAALRRGDFKQAQRELQRLSEKFKKGDMSDAEQRALQQQLQQMSRQLQQMAQQARQQQAQRQQQVAQKLQNQGLSQQQSQQLAQNGTPQQIQQALQNQMQQQGMGQQQAQQQSQQLAQQIQQMQQQNQGSQQTQNTGQNMSQALQQMSQALQQQQSSSGQQGQQGQQMGQQGMQSGGSPGQQQGMNQQAQNQMQQGNNAAQQAMNQLAQMQNQMQQMSQAQNQMQNAMQNLNGKQRGGSQRAGKAEGGNPYGPTNNPGAYGVERRRDIQQGKGRVIASWSEEGEMAAGEATVQFNQAVTSAKADAERAIVDDRVPRRYHGSIKDYFNQLPQSPDEVKQAPSAPR